MTNKDITIEKFLKKIKMELDLCDQTIEYSIKRNDYFSLLELLKRFDYTSEFCEDYEFTIVTSLKYDVKKLKGKSVELFVDSYDSDKCLILGIWDYHKRGIITEYEITTKNKHLLDIKVQRRLFSNEDIDKITKLVSTFIEENGGIIKNLQINI